jgi:hypothetical protein
MRDNVITNANRNKCNEKRIQKNVLGVERIIRSPFSCVIITLQHISILNIFALFLCFDALFSVTIAKAQK